MPQKILSDAFILKFAGYVLGFVGSLIIFSGGLAGYIFASHRKKNDEEHRELFKKSDKISEKISVVIGELKRIKK